VSDFDDQVGQWETVQAIAMQVLGRPIGLMYQQGRTSREVASILFAPSFDAVVRWDVYELRHQGRNDVTYAGARLCWRQDIDSRAHTATDRLAYLRRRHLGPIRPTFESGEYDLDADMVGPLVRRLPRTIPVVDDQTAVGVCDGESFEVSFGELYYRITCHWHEQMPVPREWTEMVAVVRELFAYCEDCHREKS